MDLTAAILWPHRRFQKIRESLATPDSYEEMDGLSTLVANGVETIVIDPSPYPLNPFLHRGSLFSGMDLLRTLRLFWLYSRIDVVVSIGESSCFWFVQAKRLLGLRKPVIIVDPAVGPSYPTRKRVQDMVLPYVDRVLVYGKIQQEYLRKQYGQKVAVTFLHHRVSTEFFNPAKLPESTDADHSTVISVGGDISRDFETLCRAAVGLDARVVVYSRKPIQATIPGNVTINKDWISYADLRRRYDDAGIVVVPLHAAMHPSGINALLEAMAMGKAVIISDSPGIRDYVNHGITAWVVPPEDPAALREAIAYLLNQPDVARELGRNARCFCKTSCALGVYGEKVASILKEVTNSRTTHGAVRLDA
jgi:glycosyltransferase involved in cell wall biosynthesis